MEYLIAYFAIALFMLLASSFAAGYHGIDIAKKDAFDSIIWPVTIVAIIGTLVRIIIEKTKNKKED